MKKVESQMQFTVTITEDERIVLMGALAIGLEQSPNNEVAKRLLKEMQQL